MEKRPSAWQASNRLQAGSYLSLVHAQSRGPAGGIDCEPRFRPTAPWFLLGVDARSRLGSGVFFAEAVAKSYFIDLSGWPQWVVVLVGTLAAVFLIWLLMKLLKLALWLFFFLVLIGGLAWAAWLLVNEVSGDAKPKPAAVKKVN
ncbi:MAG: hypothetical protein HZA93_19225 [Verrucomicrobia bacterium]|nr:hypothetical protein [Verrucomicrobiota bacterium]